MDFYTRILGFTKNWDGDPDWANLSLGDDDLSLVLKEGAVHPPHLGLQVENLAQLEQAHAHLKAAGVKMGPIKGHRDGSSSFYFTDPDGNILEALWQPADGNSK